MSLRSPPYLAQGSSLASALAHGVGHKPRGTGVDVGLVYGDYYLAQAMLLMNAVTSGDTAHGTIDRTGLYTAPLSAPTPATVTIRATSLGDPTVFDESTVTIGAAAQMAVGP